MEVVVVPGFPQDNPPKDKIVVTSSIYGVIYFILTTFFTLVGAYFDGDTVRYVILLHGLIAISGSITMVYLHEYLGYDVLGHDYILTEPLAVFTLLLTSLYYVIALAILAVMILIVSLLLLCVVLLFAILLLGPASLTTISVLFLEIFNIEVHKTGIIVFGSIYTVVVLTLLSIYLWKKPPFRRSERKPKLPDEIKFNSIFSVINDYMVSNDYIFCAVGRVIQIYHLRSSETKEIKPVAKLIGHRSAIAKIFLVENNIYTYTKLHPRLGKWEFGENSQFQTSVLHEIKIFLLKTSLGKNQLKKYKQLVNQQLEQGTDRETANNNAIIMLKQKESRTVDYEFQRLTALKINSNWIVLCDRHGFMIYDHNYTLKKRMKHLPISDEKLHLFNDQLLAITTDFTNNIVYLSKFNLKEENPVAEKIELPKDFKWHLFTENYLVLMNTMQFRILDIGDNRSSIIPRQLPDTKIIQIELKFPYLYELSVNTIKDVKYGYSFYRYQSADESEQLFSISSARPIHSFKIMKNGILIQIGTSKLRYVDFDVKEIALK